MSQTELADGNPMKPKRETVFTDWPSTYADVERWYQVMVRAVTDGSPLEYIRSIEDTTQLQDLVFLMAMLGKGFFEKEAKNAEIDAKTLLSMMKGFLLVELKEAEEKIESGEMTGDQILADLKRRFG